MSFRTIVVSSRCKLSYKAGYLVYRGDETQTIHLSEIHTIILDSTAVTITTYLICELNKNKVKVIFCDENSNPISENLPYYGSHNSSKKVQEQVLWHEDIKNIVWTEIIKKKIINQRDFLYNYNLKNHETLSKYITELTLSDTTNREGLSAKVYFRSLFGNAFNREEKNNINIALNYGYTIILATFNKEIVSKGYITQLGFNHKNQFNHFNLSCDLMEPFRCVIDNIVYNNKDRVFDHDYKMELVNILNMTVKFDNKEVYLSNAINLYVNSVFKAINKNNINELKFGELLWGLDLCE